jgi:hypothetical protein
MRSARFVCLFVIFASAMLAAQSNRVPFMNQPNAPPSAQQKHPALPPNLYQITQGPPFVQRGPRAFEATGFRRGSPSSGLNFAPAVAYNSGGLGAQSITVADVNGDGKPDLVLANYCATTFGDCSNGASVGVLLGDGDGTFQTAVPYSSGGVEAYSIAVADVNGDGKPDLLVLNWCADSSCETGSSVGVLLGNGDGTFQTAVPYNSGGFNAPSIAVADVNGDGKPDLLVANNVVINNNSYYSAVNVLLGNGDGTFQTAVPYNSGGNGSTSVAVADVNGDGKPDLLVTNYCDNGCQNNTGVVSVLLGNGDGTFQTAVPYNSGGYDANSVSVADTNGDGKPDLLVANICTSGDDGCTNNNGIVAVLIGNGDGTFQTASTYYTAGLWAYSIAVADVNGDGKPDLIVTDWCADSTCANGLTAVLLGNGDGTFQIPATFNSGAEETQSVAVTDVNGDGKPDLLTANWCVNSTCPNGAASVLINTSLNGTTTTLSSSPNPSNFGQAVTFTATVTGQQGFYKGAPTGTVSFYDGTTNIGNSNLNSGMATLMTSTLAVGTHSMTATYNGDTNFVPSTSPPLNQLVQGSIASLSPGSLNFGNQTVGITSSPQNVTLTNNGNINLTISLIQITGTNSGDFNQTNNCPSSLTPNNSCQIGVTFTPTTTGTRNAAVSITDNAPGSPQSVPVTGVGVLPAVTFYPTNINFGDQGVGTTSNPQVTTLTNSGAGVLTITSIGITGANKNDFAQTNNCPSSVPSNGSCQISVTFTPTGTGTRNAAVSVTDNAPGSPQSVPLTGVGTPPAVTLSPTSLTFSNQVVFTTSPVQPVTLTNSGTGVLKIKHISVTSPFSQTNNCPSSLGPGADCTISVKFRPANKGVFHGAVSVADNASGNPQKVPLTGTGTFVQLAPAKLNFGTQPVGTRSLPKKIAMTNKGDSAINITGIAITGTDAGDFAETNTCGKSLASGASCFIKVTFKPLAKGKRTADVSIYDNGGGSPQAAKLIGTGT